MPNTIAAEIKAKFQGNNVSVNLLGGFTITGTVADGTDDLLVLNNLGVLTTIAGNQIVAYNPL